MQIQCPSCSSMWFSAHIYIWMLVRQILSMAECHQQWPMLTMLCDCDQSYFRQLPEPNYNIAVPSSMAVIHLILLLFLGHHYTPVGLFLHSNNRS